MQLYGPDALPNANWQKYTLGFTFSAYIRTPEGEEASVPLHWLSNVSAPSTLIMLIYKMLQMTYAKGKVSDVITILVEGYNHGHSEVYQLSS